MVARITVWPHPRVRAGHALHRRLPLASRFQKAPRERALVRLARNSRSPGHPGSRDAQIVVRRIVVEGAHEAEPRKHSCVDCTRFSYILWLQRNIQEILPRAQTHVQRLTRFDSRATSNHCLARLFVAYNSIRVNCDLFGICVLLWKVLDRSYPYACNVLQAQPHTLCFAFSFIS